MRPRIEEELALLHTIYNDIQHAEHGGEDWFLLPRYAIPPGWTVGGEPTHELPIAFLVKADYPSAPPYGFLMPQTTTFGGVAPQSTGGAPNSVPFRGEWLLFSWTVDNWAPATSVKGGSNLAAWCRSFVVRLKEGA